MKKRLLVLTLVTVMCFSLVACGKSANKSSNDGNSQGIEVDKNLLTVEVTLPASFFKNEDGEDITQEELDVKVSEDSGLLSAKVNADGSVTYKMTKSKQKEMLKEMKSSADEGIAELINDDSVNFTSITYNDNLTEFIIETPNTSLGLFDSLYVIAFYMFGSQYNALAGEEVDDIVVYFVNSNTGETIDECHMADMANNSNSSTVTE